MLLFPEGCLLIVALLRSSRRYDGCCNENITWKFVKFAVGDKVFCDYCESFHLIGTSVFIWRQRQKYFLLGLRRRQNYKFDKLASKKLPQTACRTCSTIIFPQSTNHVSDFLLGVASSSELQIWQVGIKKLPQTACRTCSTIIFPHSTNHVSDLWRFRWRFFREFKQWRGQRQRHKSMIWLVEGGKIIVLHVRHAF